VQFVHRTLAYIVAILIIMIWYRIKKSNPTKLQLKGGNILLALLAVQFLLGIFTLVLHVPVWLGVTHQIGAFFLLSAITFTLHRFSK